VSILTPFGSVLAASQASSQQSANYLSVPLITGLPWAVGETWNFTQNFHGGQNALDFQTITGSAGRVLAADSGTVVSTPTSTCILVDRGDGIRLGYQHLEPSDLAKFKAGNYIYKGQFLGMTTSKPGCGGTTDGNVVHFWAEGAANFQVGSIIGGFTVGSICVNQPSLNKNGVKYCPVQKITYTGDSIIRPTVFINGVSTLYQDQSWGRANLKICADNLPGNTVYVLFSRSGKIWEYSQAATSTCVTFWDMDGAGSMLRYTTYSSRAALNQKPNPAWAIPCAGPSGGQGLCDNLYRP